jgi:hypothetical protein
MTKPPLTIEHLLSLAKQFCEQESKTPNNELFGVTDGKAVGTHIEHKFKNFLLTKYDMDELLCSKTKFPELQKL